MFLLLFLQREPQQCTARIQTPQHTINTTEIEISLRRVARDCACAPLCLYPPHATGLLHCWVVPALSLYFGSDWTTCVRPLHCITTENTLRNGENHTQSKELRCHAKRTASGCVIHNRYNNCVVIPRTALQHLASELHKNKI